jgi:hypothetical protein
MVGSALGNGDVYGGLDNGEKTFYGLAQKMVSGALSAYAGVNAFGDVHLYKADGKHYFGGSKAFAKAWRGGWYNVASDWAHTSEEKWKGRSFHFGTSLAAFAGGFVGGWMSNVGMNYYEDIYNHNQYLGILYGAGVNYTAGLSEYTIQYLGLARNEGSSYLPWGYKYHGVKMGIWSYKSLMYGFTGVK